MLSVAVCTFNTLLLPASTSLERVNELAKASLRLTFAPQGNRSIEAAVGPDAHSFVRAVGHCDCGAGVGKLEPPQSAACDERALRKLRQQGWSDAKIERWIAERVKTQQKRDAERERILDADRATNAAWYELVRGILDERAASWVGLFTHDYHGAIETERVPCNAIRRIKGVTLEQIADIDPDTAYVFAR
jgi:hypothetical protein